MTSQPNRNPKRSVSKGPLHCRARRLCCSLYLPRQAWVLSLCPHLVVPQNGKVQNCALHALYMDLICYVGGSPTNDSSQESCKPAKRARTRSPDTMRAEAAANYQQRMKAREREDKRARRAQAEKSERTWMESIQEGAHEHFASRASSAAPGNGNVTSSFYEYYG